MKIYDFLTKSAVCLMSAVCLILLILSHTGLLMHLKVGDCKVFFYKKNCCYFTCLFLFSCLIMFFLISEIGSMQHTYGSQGNLGF